MKRRLYDLLPLRSIIRRVRGRVVAFHYHMAADAAPPHVAHLFRVKPPALLEADLRFLRAHFPLLHYDDVRAGRAGAMVSFDDGYAECHRVVRPLLLSLGIPATFFVNTGSLDNAALMWPNLLSLVVDGALRLDSARRRALAAVLGVPPAAADSAAALARAVRSFSTDDPRLSRAAELAGVDEAAYLRDRRPYLTRAEAAELAADGFTLGGHTHTHPRLGALRCREALEREVAGSCREVAALAGREEVPFAFPFSGDGVDRAALAAIRRRNPEIGVVFDTGRLRTEHPWLLHRIAADRPSPGAATNLPYLLRRAVVAAATERITDLLTPLRRRTPQPGLQHRTRPVPPE